MLPWMWRKQDDEIEEKADRTAGPVQARRQAARTSPASLSGGQRKLLEMARALMSDPTLVMLDEPMAGVNPALTQSLLDHILDLKEQGMTVLFVEHDMHMVRAHRRLGHRHGARARIVAEGPPDVVMKDPAVIDAYLGSHHDTDLGRSSRGRIAPHGATRRRTIWREHRTIEPRPLGASTLRDLTAGYLPGVNILNDCSISVATRRADRHHRPERRRQVDAAQGDLRPGEDPRRARSCSTATTSPA